MKCDENKEQTALHAASTNGNLTIVHLLVQVKLCCVFPETEQLSVVKLWVIAAIVIAQNSPQQ